MCNSAIGSVTQVGSCFAFFVERVKSITPHQHKNINLLKGINWNVLTFLSLQNSSSQPRWSLDSLLTNRPPISDPWSKPVERRRQRPSRRHAATGALRLEVLPGVLQRADHGGSGHLSERRPGDSPRCAERGAGLGRRTLMGVSPVWSPEMSQNGMRNQTHNWTGLGFWGFNVSWKGFFGRWPRWFLPWKGGCDPGLPS